MTLTAPHPTSTATAPSARSRTVAVGTALSAVVVSLLVHTHPWGDRLDSGAADVVSYAGLPADIDTAWAGIVLDALASGLLATCVTAGCWRLVRTRGRLAATIGGVLAVVGGLVGAMGGAAFGTLLWFAATLPEDEGRGLVEAVNGQIGHALGLEVAGFVLVALAGFVLSGALIRSRAVPWPPVVLFLLLTVSLFLGFSARVTDVLQAAQVVVAGTLSVPLWRRG